MFDNPSIFQLPGLYIILYGGRVQKRLAQGPPQICFLLALGSFQKVRIAKDNYKGPDNN